MSNRRSFGFAELEIVGTRECPRCHVPFIPHIGNLISATFQCRSCNADLSYRSYTKKTVKCPCCNFFRPLPNSLTMVTCGGCEATVIYERGARTVKCCLCKHITNPPEEVSVGALPPLQANQNDSPLPPQASPIVPPFPGFNHVAPPQANRVVPLPGVNHVVPPQANRVVPPPPQSNPFVFPPSEVNRVAPPHLQANRVVPSPPPANRFVFPPPKVNRVVSPPVGFNPVVPPLERNRTEYTASSSSNPIPESQHTIVVNELDADSVARIVINVSVGIRKTKRETEEDKTDTESKKIRRE